MSEPPATRVLVAGTFDPLMARNRVILGLLERAGYTVDVVHEELWDAKRYLVVDQPKTRLVLRALRAYGRLVSKLLRTGRHDVIVVLYPGYFDVPLLRIFGRVRRVPILFDTFISLHDTVVGDRALRTPGSPLGRLTRLADRISCRLADMVVTDTPSQAAFLVELTGLPGDRFRVLWLGAQEDVFYPAPDVEPQPDLVLFHGTFIRLQGLDTIVRAAKLLESDGIRIRILGDGQERGMVEGLMRELEPSNVELVGLVPRGQLREEIASASLCLGIFGRSAKAQRVVPNKVFECLAVGRPVLTADTPAIRSAFGTEVAVVPPGDAAALAEGIRSLLGDRARLDRLAVEGRARFERDYSEAALTRLLSGYVDELTSDRPPAGARRRRVLGRGSGRGAGAS